MNVEGKQFTPQNPGFWTNQNLVLSLHLYSPEARILIPSASPNVPPNFGQDRRRRNEAGERGVSRRRFKGWVPCRPIPSLRALWTESGLLAWWDSEEQGKHDQSRGGASPWGA